MELNKPFPAAPRNELMKLFDSLSSKRLLYVHAPPGYGKSYSARLWLNHIGVSWSWIAVNESAGRKPIEFCERFMAALFNLQPDNRLLKEMLEHKSFATAPFEFLEQALKEFRYFVRGSDQKCAIVIDDLHLIKNNDTLSRLPEFIKALTDNVTFCILSRAEPPDSFSELVVKDDIAIVGAERLKFSESEIKSFFRACGQSLTSKQAEEIKASTDGWAIGLNAILLSGNQQTGRKLLSRYLENFIREQVWAKWDKNRQDFMLRISVTDELTPDFCDAMTGRTDSSEQLSMLVRENAFMSSDKPGRSAKSAELLGHASGDCIYRFHHLFQDFLRHMLEGESEKLRNELYQNAGNWFYDHLDYYKAVEYYIKSGDKNGITKGLKLMYDYNSPYAAIEDTLSIIRLSVNASIVDEYPFLLEVQAWAAFVEGRGVDMEGYLDKYFKQLPKIILQNPASAQTALLLRCMDYRNSMISVTKSLKKLPLKLFAQANTPSITQNMPLFHRSSRDYSEYAADDDANYTVFRKTIGVLVGEEFEVMELLIRAGLAYERGVLNKAHELALSANVKVKENFAPETKFCSFMIIAVILDAQGQRADAQKILEAARSMLEHHKAYYLNANFRAFSCRLKLSDGDLETAREWLKHSESPYNSLTFYKLYQHFTTARSLIVTGDYNTAILFLKKLQSLCEQYCRPLDTIEANILLAIAYWKRVRGLQNEALEPLTQAIMSAKVYGFTQIFTNEGAELSNMLHRLQKRVIQKGYYGEITPAQVKTLHIAALSQAKHSKGLTGGRTPENLKFTEQQKKVMRYLMEGLTHKEIGNKMELKPSAIKSHMILIFKKLDVSNGMDAMIKIRELGLLDDE